MKSAAIGYGDFGVDERTGLSAIATGNAPAVPDVRLVRRGAADYDPEGDAGDARAE